MLNLNDFLVLIHVLVTVRVRRAGTQAFDREQRSVLAGVSPLFLRTSLLSSVSRVPLRSRLSSQSRFVSGTATLWKWMFRQLTLCCIQSNPYPDVGF